ncbi:MAG: ABC transporter substrate-binding protein [Actinomycetota bacterium]|nr:ABC transporter substrate-binding protein [Actinomycetota bacterium]
MRSTVLVLIFAITTSLLTACGGAGDGDAGAPGEDRSFAELEEEARGTTVNFHLYGGDEAINAYVDDYVTPRLEKEYGITLNRVPLTDTADAVNKLLNEKQAGKDEGTIDLVWINGENFATGAEADLWFGPWAEGLPNARYINWESPSINRDFGLPVEGREAPWGRAQFVMIYDSAKVEDPPRNMEELMDWTEENPGRFTYPAPPDFTGNAFVEQALYGLTGGPGAYQRPFDDKVFAENSPEVYKFLNDIESKLWREGETYPESSAKLDGLYQNGEVYLSMSYNPRLAQRQVDKGLWPESTRTYLLEGGTLSNTHYVAVPFNSPNKAGAQVVANFLQSPEAQMAKQDPDGWGDLTTLDVDRLPDDAREALTRTGGRAALPADELQENRVPEARAEWLLELEDGWQEKVLSE